MSDEELINDSRTDVFSYLINTTYCSFFVDESFVNSAYKDIIVFSNAAVCKYSNYKETLGLEKELGSNQIYLSSNYFRNYFKEEFDKSKIGDYLVPNTTTMTLGEGMEPDVIFDSEDLEVVGVFDVPSDYQEQFSSSMAMIVSDDYFDEYASSQCYIHGMTFETKNDYSKLKTLFAEHLGTSIYLHRIYKTCIIMLCKYTCRRTLYEEQ